MKRTQDLNRITLEKITDCISDFFISRGFTEVNTPLVIPAPVPEPYIDFIKKSDGYLRPSPEIEMKILLSQGHEKIFQIGPCFRKGEKGRLHKEEFTMLEWYEAGADYNNLMEFTRDMILFLADKILSSTSVEYNGETIELASGWEIMTVAQAFAKFADTSPQEAIKKGIFEDTLVNQVEPFLSRKRPVILKDYPSRFAALAKLKEGDIKASERWELYLGGIEIANTYSELIDPVENRARFAKFAEERQALNKEPIPVNEEFFQALEKGIPESSGCALGIDRLAMIINDVSNINDLMSV